MDVDGSPRSRMPYLDLVSSARIVGEAEIPRAVVIPRVRLQRRRSRLRRSVGRLPTMLSRTYWCASMSCPRVAPRRACSRSRRPSAHSGSDVRRCKVIGSEGESLRPLAWGRFGTVIDVDAVRTLALSLPRWYEVLVRDRVKFRVGRIVYLAFSRDETLMGFAFPKEERRHSSSSRTIPDAGPVGPAVPLGGGPARGHRRRRDARARPRRVADGGSEAGRRRARRPRMRSEACAARERRHAVLEVESFLVLTLD